MGLRARPRNTLLACLRSRRRATDDEGAHSCQRFPAVYDSAGADWFNQSRVISGFQRVRQCRRDMSRLVLRYANCCIAGSSTENGSTSAV